MTTQLKDLDATTRCNVKRWLEGGYDENTKAVIRDWLDNDPQKVMDSFFTELSFGTGGLRGIMGVGSNRMNEYTVRAATQGLANYIKKQFPAKENSVLIGYDSRHNSREFAIEVARVLSGNGIRVYFLNALRPTPYVSFGCRYKKCQAGVMITASHNPKAYNGYKVYWDDGGQIVPPHDKGIIDEVKKVVDVEMVQVKPFPNPMVEIIDDEIDKVYLKTINNLQICPKDNKTHGGKLKVLYSSLHGTGITAVPQSLKSWGFDSIAYVEEQREPDGDFPTVEYPNPEEVSALKIGMRQLIGEEHDILIATDPDCDRIGVVVYHHGEAILLDGNQLGCVLAYHVCSKMSEKGILPSNAAFIKSVVTTELFKAIIESYDRPCFDVLCGFKYYAGQILDWEEQGADYKFIFGAEDSCGYLLGDYTRDKDAAIASSLVCEASLQAKLDGKTLVDLLHDIYDKYGVYGNKLVSLKFEATKEGLVEMASIMSKLRMSPPKSIGGKEVLIFEDYEISKRINYTNGEESVINLPSSNVLTFWLSDGSRLVVRPSGTEPKVKLYCSAREVDYINVPTGLETCLQRCDSLIEEFRQLI